MSRRNPMKRIVLREDGIIILSKIGVVRSRRSPVDLSPPIAGFVMKIGGFQRSTESVYHGILCGITFGMIIIYRVKIEVYGNVLVIKKSYISASTVHSYFLEQMVGPYIYVLFHSRNKLSRSGISHTEGGQVKRIKKRPNAAETVKLAQAAFRSFSPSKTPIPVLFLAMSGGGNHISPPEQPVAASCTRRAFKNSPECAPGSVFASEKALRGGIISASVTSEAQKRRPASLGPSCPWNGRMVLGNLE